MREAAVRALDSGSAFETLDVIDEGGVPARNNPMSLS